MNDRVGMIHLMETVARFQPMRQFGLLALCRRSAPKKLVDFAVAVAFNDEKAVERIGRALNAPVRR